MVAQQGGVHDPENFERLACLHKIHPTPTHLRLPAAPLLLPRRASEREAGRCCTAAAGAAAVLEHKHASQAPPHPRFRAQRAACSCCCVMVQRSSFTSATLVASDAAMRILGQALLAADISSCNGWFGALQTTCDARANVGMCTGACQFGVHLVSGLRDLS